MSERHGAVWWTELMTRDVQKAREYYADICGWSFEAMEMPEGTYHVGKHGDRGVVGIMDIRGAGGDDIPPVMWLSYFAVDDVDAAVERTRAAGGKIHREPWDITGIGRLAVVSDPTGAIMGLITPSDADPMAA